MKTLLVTLGITAGLVASLSAQGTSGPSGRRAKAKSQTVEVKGVHYPSVQRVVVTDAPISERATYYYTTDVPTGSQIPTVIRRYKGVIHPVGASRGYDVFTGGDVGATGFTDLHSALTRLEPDLF